MGGKKSISGTVRTTIKVKGKDQSEKTLEIGKEAFHFIIHREINKIPFARILLNEGDLASREFLASDSSEFVPGNEIEISTGYEDSQESIFQGVITKHALRMKNGNGSLEIEARDRSSRMTLNRKSAFFPEQTDSKAFKKIIESYGLKALTDTTNVEHEMLVQNNVSDWDFIVTRAEVNGCFVMPNNNTVSIKKLAIDDSKVTVIDEREVIDFEAEMDARNQPEKVVAQAWSVKSNAKVLAESKDPKLPKQGNVGGDELAKSFETGEVNLYGGATNEKELQAWADAKMIKSRLAKIRGYVKCNGNVGVEPGTLIELTGWGDRFSGKAFVSGIRHEIVEGTWTIAIQFGIENEMFSNNKISNGSGGPCLIPPTTGLHVGIVLQIEKDPENSERIKVELPGVQEINEGVWARLSTFDAGPNRGSFFRPEVGDEVVVGFVNDDPRSPVILGSLHSSHAPSPEEPSKSNNRKGLETREGQRLVFDDEEGSIVLGSSNANLVELSDGLGGIKIEDENGNSITMSSKGIELKSASDIILDATRITSPGDINIEANNLKTDCAGSLEMTSGSTAILKGAIVQIN